MRAELMECNRVVGVGHGSVGEDVRQRLMRGEVAIVPLVDPLLRSRDVGGSRGEIGARR
jgi:uncharacterized GH25 family protein